MSCPLRQAKTPAAAADDAEEATSSMAAPGRARRAAIDGSLYPEVPDPTPHYHGSGAGDGGGL